MQQATKKEKPKLTQPVYPKRQDFPMDYEGEQAYQKAVITYREARDKYEQQKKAAEAVKTKEVKTKPPAKEEPAEETTTLEETEEAPKAESLTAQLDALKLGPPRRGKAETFAEFLKRIRIHKTKIKELEKQIADANKKKK